MSELQIQTVVNIEGYTEPLYISKRERFDEDMYMAIVQDENFCKTDRDYLKRYFKERRESGGVATVVYQFGKGCDIVRLGRLFPTLGLGTMRFDIRNVLTAKFYWDIDFENCHYRIALKLCKEYGIQCDKIEDYINNREEWLNKVSPDRWVAKTVFLRTAYGGNVKLYREDYEDKSGAITLNDEVQLFVNQLSKQFNFLAEKLWDVNKDLQKLKCGKDNKPISKRDNPKFSLLSYILSTEERKHLLFLDWYLQKKDRYMGILIHDGGNVEKLSNETEFPVELLRECEEAVNKKFGTGMKLAIKPINHSYVIPEKIKSLPPYEKFKNEVEEDHFFLQGKMKCITGDEIIQLTKTEIIDKLKPKNWVEEDAKGKPVKKYFYNEWLEDETRKEYESIDFIPDVEKCPVKTYNLFKGFQAEKYKCELSKEEIVKNVEPILYHLNLLTGGYASYMCKWLSNIIQQPDMKSGVAPLLRDQSGFLNQGGGTGKNLFFEWFGNNIIGERYFLVVGSNKTLYGDFNSQFEGKLLIMIEEAGSKENHLNLDILNSRITGKKLNVNKKSIAQYCVNDYARYIFTTNNRNALPIRSGNRRYAVFDTNTEKRGKVEYFDKLVEHLSNDKVKYSFYQYLRELELYKTPIEYSVNIPLTTGYIEMKKLNAPLYLKWIVSVVRNGLLKNAPMGDLHQDYMNWLKENKEGGEDKGMTLTAFGLLLNNDRDANDEYNVENTGEKKKNAKGLIEYRFNVSGVVEGLKKLSLIEDDFVYESEADREKRIQQEYKDALELQMKEKMECEMMADEDVNAYQEQTTEEDGYDSDAELIEYEDSDDE